MTVDGSEFTGWATHLVELFFGFEDDMEIDDEIVISAIDSEGVAHTVLRVSMERDEDGIAEEYDEIVDALTYPAQVVHAGTSVPSFEEFVENHDDLDSYRVLVYHPAIVELENPFSLAIHATK